MAEDISQTNTFRIPDDYGPLIRPEEFLEKEIAGGIKIPDNIAFIGGRAFFRNKIGEVQFSQNLEEIGERAFCMNNISRLELPDKLERIEDSAFALNPIQHVDIPVNLIFLGNSAFCSRDLRTIKFNLSGLTLDLSTILTGILTDKEFIPIRTGGAVKFVPHKGWQEIYLEGEGPDHAIYRLLAYSTTYEVGSFVFRDYRDYRSNNPDAYELAGTSRDDDKKDSFCRGDVFRNYFSIGQLEQKYGRLIESRVLRQNVNAAAKQI